MESKKLVLFGAGKIGRSFIAQLFSQSGYETVFIDIDEQIISELNKRNQYKVVIKSDDGDDEVLVKNVKGIHVSKRSDVLSEISDADIIAISVGQKAIPAVAKLLAGGLELRVKERPHAPIDIIIAENLRHAGRFVRSEVEKHISSEIDIQSYVGLVETSIGKMVPIMSKQETDQDVLMVFAEPYNTLIVDKKGFKNPVPDVRGLDPKENILAWVDRKSFIHNLGHAAAAYYGYVKYPKSKFLFQVMSKQDVFSVTKATMLESADVLMKHYPGEFSTLELTNHIDDLLYRFSNRSLGDTVYRVGQDLYRKLSPNDRLIGVLQLALKYRMPYDRILYIIACAIRFQAVDEQGMTNESDLRFNKEAQRGIDHVLNSVCKIDKDSNPLLYEKAEKISIN